MPYVDVYSPDEPGSLLAEEESHVRLFYHTYGKGAVRIMLIMGLAAGHDAWKPQLIELAGTDLANEMDENEEERCCSGESEAPLPSNEQENDSQETGGICCAFDNRGVGKSSVPSRKSAYTTDIMAKDVIALADHLNWDKFHVVGHSMGGMIALKVASLFPKRVISLSMISVTGGGYETIPRVTLKTLNVMYRFSRAKTPHERAHVDLDTHYSQKFLEANVNGSKRRHLLHKEYISQIEKTKMQHPHGLNGHFNACWSHRVTNEDVDSIKSSKILTSVIHGRDDIIAQIKCAENLTLRLRPFARMVELPGAHMVTVESKEMVNHKLKETILSAEKSTPLCTWLKSCSLSEVMKETEASESCSCVFCFPRGSDILRSGNEQTVQESVSVFTNPFFGPRSRLKRRYFSLGESSENALQRSEFFGQVEKFFGQEMEKDESLRGTLTNTSKVPAPRNWTRNRILFGATATLLLGLILIFHLLKLMHSDEE